MSRNLRRHDRFDLASGTQLTWTDNSGTHYARGRCLDVSASGARVELPVTIPARTYVTFTTDKPRLDTTASVRYCQRKGIKYVVGLEFSAAIANVANKLGVARKSDADSDHDTPPAPVVSANRNLQ